MIDQEERLRRDAALWFARMRGPGADAHRGAFESWRATATHREAYQRLVRRFEESAVLGGSQLEGLRLSRSPRTRGMSAGGRVILALAACGIAAIGLTLFTLNGGAPPWHQQRYATRLGEIRTIALADGATLTLDTDSAAAAAIEKGRQVVRLQRGRARLVATNAAPLALEAGEARLMAQASTLDLDLGPERQVVVTVLSGSPQLGVRQGPLRRILYRPLPGRHVRLARAEQPRPAQTDPAAEAAWPQGLRTFQKTPLAAVTNIANRYDRRKIRFDDPGIGLLEVTGVFRVTETERLARALAATFGLTVRTVPGGDLVLSRQAA